jgi:hypothetical protein
MADTPLTNLDTVTSTDRTAAGSQPDFSTPTGTTGTGGGGGSPTGAAGGDLGGSYPNPKVLGMTANTVTLTLGNINAGQYLLRSGSTIIGGTPSGAGNVNGPGSSVNNHVALFNGTSGTAIKDSGVTLTAGTGTPALTVNGTADVSGSNTGDQTNISGNAGTASALNPGATINSVNFTGTAAITVYDATKLPLAGGTMTGAIAMGANKITGLANGTAATDAAAFGQIPSSLPPSGAAGGELSGTYPNPLVNLLHTNVAVHTAFMGPISGSDVPSFRLIVASDIPTLNQNTTGSAGSVPYSGLTGTVPTWNQNTTGNAASATILQNTRQINGVNFNGSANITVADDTKLPLAGGTMSGAINMGASKINNLSNGTAAQDAAAFGQIPTALPPNGAASGSLGGTYPSPTVTAINETSGPTKLTIGSVSDGQVLKRSGSTLIGASVGTGDVTGPSSSVAGRVATFSTTSGKVIQDSGVSISDVVVQGGNATLSIAAITQLKLDPQLGYPTGGPITFDLSVSRNRIALTVNLTVSATSNRANSVSSVLELYNSTSGYLTITWSQAGTWKTNGVLPTVIAPGQTLQFLFQCWGTTESDVSVNYINQLDFNVFNVRDYGATGNASTDDRTAIANADSAANAARGVLVFPAGTYYIASDITLSASPRFDGGALTIASGKKVTFNQAVVAPVQRLFYGSGTVRMAYRGAKCPVEWWGAGTGTESVQVDDKSYIQAALDACRNYGGDIFAEVVFSKQYWLSDEVIVYSSVGISTGSASAVMSKTTSGTGKGMRFQGTFDANRIWTLPNFSGFSVFAVKVDKVSTARFYIGLISGDGNGDGIAVGCNDAGSSTLDNIFHVNYIAGCKSGIRIYCKLNSDSGSLATIEGNEFNVNFVNQCLNGVVFDSLDDYTLPITTYTKGSAWDCNIFNITALDAGPGYKRGYWYRATGLQYSEQVFRVPVWFGGFDSNGIWIDADTVTKSTFEIGVRTGEQMNNYGQFKLKGSGNTVVINGSGNAFGDQLTPDTFTALTSSGRSSFNGGTPVPRNRMKVNFVLPADRSFGDTQTFYLYSPLVDGYSNRLRISFIDSGGFIVNNLYDNSNSVANEIVVVLQNASGATRYSGFTISAWVEIAY